MGTGYTPNRNVSPSAAAAAPVYAASAPPSYAPSAPAAAPSGGKISYQVFNHTLHPTL